MTTLGWGAVTDSGRIRDVNQDGVLSTERVFVVADGMGGHRGGEVASAIAVELMAETSAFNSVEELLEAVQRANREVLERAGRDRALYGMGTTLVALAAVTVDGTDLLCAVNVGDSRLYLRTTDAMMQLTEDHSLVEGMVQDGWITPEEAKVHPQRNVVTRALGVEEPLFVDAWELVPVAGDRYLLCSDGLNNELDDAEIEEILDHTADPQHAASELVRAACDAGGRDNVTVVVVDVVDADPRGPDPPADRVVAIHSSGSAPTGSSADAALCDATDAADATGAAGATGAADATDAEGSGAEPEGVAASADAEAASTEPDSLSWRSFVDWRRLEAWPLGWLAALVLVVLALLLVLSAVL